MKEKVLKCVKNNKVDWKKLYELYEKYPHSSNEIYSCLETLGFLTLRAKGNFGLTCGVSCNPSCSGAQLYFMSREDAAEYKTAFYTGSAYRVQLIQFIS
jgi:hypothetical protein